MRKINPEEVEKERRALSKVRREAIHLRLTNPELYKFILRDHHSKSGRAKHDLSGREKVRRYLIKKFIDLRRKDHSIRVTEAVEAIQDVVYFFADNNNVEFKEPIRNEHGDKGVSRTFQDWLYEFQKDERQQSMKKSEPPLLRPD